MFKFTLPAAYISLFLISPSLQLDQPICLSLNQSTFCGGDFREYFVARGAWFEHFQITDIKSFDVKAEQYFGSPNDIWNVNNFTHCGYKPGWDGLYQPPYRASYGCAQLLDLYPSKSCNVNNPPPALCKSACLSYVAGWSVLLSNQTACQSTSPEAESFLNNTKEICENYPFNGVDGNCITGLEDQPNTCGYILPQQKDSLCTFCSVLKLPCCQSPAALSCPGSSAWREKHHISTAALVCSIVFGCLGGIGLISLVIFLYLRRRYSKQSTEKNVEEKEASMPDLLNSTVSLNVTRPSVCEYVCEYPYKPALPDELLLEVGDVLAIMWMFNDGWAVGNNLTRGGEGAFPMACVTTVLVDNLDSNASTISNRIPRRVSSRRGSNRSM